MHPGVSDTQCRYAELHYRELVKEGLRQQLVASALRTSDSPRSSSTSPRQQFGTLLVRAGQRLQGAQAITRDSLGSVAVSERGAVA